MDSSIGSESHRAVEPRASEQLPFDESRQDAALGHLLTNRTFFLTCKDRIKSSWFVAPLNQRVWAAALDYWNAYELIPRPDTDLLQHNAIQRESQAIRNACEAQIKKSIHQASLFHLKAIEEELTDWLRARIFYEGVNLSAETWNRGQMKEAYEILSKTSRNVQDTVFHPDIAANFESLDPLFASYELSLDNALTFGCTAVDKLILRGARTGGLLPGGTTIFLAPTDIGKTTTLMTVACANIKRGKSVLYIAHEGIMQQMQLRFLCCMLCESLDWLIQNWKNPDPGIQQRIHHAQRLLKTFLVFVPYVKAGMTVETVVSIIRRRQEERATKFGHGFDLLCDDYAAKLTTEEARGGKLEKRQNLEVVYGNFVALGLEYGFHHLGAIQGNREASKINKQFKGYEDRLLEVEDVCESMAVMNDAHQVITINRPPIAQAQQWVTYHLAKSKFAETGWAMVCRSRFGSNVSHSDDLGAIWYRGTSSGYERMSELLTSYNNVAVPETEKF